MFCQKSAEYMRAQGSGSIVNFSSIYGLVVPDFSIYKGTSMTMPAAYSAVKSGIIGFTRYLNVTGHNLVIDGGRSSV